MPDDLASLLPARRPTAAQPLIGQTVLIVDDSRFACEGLRQMCLRSGARLRRADCLNSARRHLASYPPTVVIVDIGLPDGCGTELIAEIARMPPPAPVLIAISGDDGQAEAAMAAGAATFLEKPVTSLAAFQSEILALLPRDAQPRGPRAVPDHDMAPDLRALADDLAHIGALMRAKQDTGTAAYILQFLRGIARMSNDDELAAATEAAARDGFEGARPRLGTLVEDRIALLAAV